MERDRPVPPLTPEKVELDGKQNQHAAYYKVYFRDANGKLWYTRVGTFLYDMKPEENHQA